MKRFHKQCAITWHLWWGPEQVDACGCVTKRCKWCSSTQTIMCDEHRFTDSNELIVAYPEELT